METNRLQFYRFIFLLILFLSIKSKSIGQLVINEVCSKNDSVILDEYGESSDWIEIYNGGSEAVNIGGYYLSDDATLLTKSLINPDVPNFVPPKYRTTTTNTFVSS